MNNVRCEASRHIGVEGEGGVGYLKYMVNELATHDENNKFRDIYCIQE
jgi:hypothetical protein